MFDPVFESLRKATECTIQAQQEMFKQWATMWTGFIPSQSTGAEQLQHFQKKWADIASDLVKKQQESLENQFKVGLRNLEESFRLAKTKDPEELRAKTIELWQRSFDCLRQAYEAQIRDFQMAVTRWTELMMKASASNWAAT